MQSRQARWDPLRCIARPSSSSVSTLLWLFLHLNFLRSFRHRFKMTDGTEMMLNKHKRWIHSSRVKFPWLECQHVGFWCRCTWFGFSGPNWFDRTTNQAQLCGSCKHVSLSGFFPFWSTWSLPRCPQTHTQQSFLMRRLDVWGNKINIIQIIDHSLRLLPFVIVWGERTSRVLINKSPCSLWLWFVFPRTATIRSHSSRAGIPSNLNPASKEMISDSVELCETEVGFLLI